MSTRKTPRLRSAGGAILGLLAVGTAIALAVPTMAAYVDTSNARTGSISASVQPTFQPGLAKNSRMVDTGLGLSTTGDVYVWGRTNLAANGGAANPGTSREPQRVPLPAGTIRQITGGIYNINALDVSGNVWGWGSIDARDGTDAPKANDNPQRIRIGTAWNGTGALLSNMLTITSTETAGAGIRADGTIWHWGQNTGYGGNAGAGASQLTGLPNPAVAGNRPVYLKGSYTNFFVILQNGDVYYWGGTGGNSLPGGAGNVDAVATKLTALNPWTRAVTGPNAPHIIAVDGGINMGGALLSDGRMLSWGSVATRTGRGGPNPTTPAIIPTLANISSMQFGYTGVVMIDTQNRLWGYGASDDYGQLPILPVLVDQNVKQYAVGQGYYLWQKQDNTFWGRGYNPAGAIGTPIGTQAVNRQINLNLGVVAQ